MPSLVFDGDRYVLSHFKYQCLLCKDTIESKHSRDFVSCSCSAVSLDGGVKEGRILGNANEMRDVSVWKTEGPSPKVLPQHVLDKRLKALVDRGF